MGFFTKKALTPPANGVEYQNILNALYRFISTGTQIQVSKTPQDFVEKGYLANINVYSIISRILDLCTGVPFYPCEVKKDIKTGKIEKERIEHVQIESLLSEPNIFQSFTEYLETFLGNYLITGNAYSYNISPDAGANQGLPTQLFVLPSNYTRIVGGGVLNPVHGFQVEGIFTDELLAEKVWHMKTFNPDFTITGNQLYGMSPIQAGMYAVAANNDSYLSLYSAFKNQAPAGFISRDTGESSVTKEQLEQLKGLLKDNSGTENARKLIATTAALKWNQIGLSPVDLAIIESQKMSMRDIANIYHYPAGLLNDGDSSQYANIKPMRKVAITDCVLPLLDKFTAGFNRNIISKFAKKEGKNIIVDYDITVFQELQDDLTTLVGALAQAWWLTGNEKRIKSGFERSEIPQMDDIMFPMTGIPSSEMGVEDINTGEEILARHQINDYK